MTTDDPEDEFDPLVSDPPEPEETPVQEPAQVWVNVLPEIDEGLRWIHRSIRTASWESLAIINYAEAVSNAIPKDIVDHPEWKAMDHDRRYGPLPVDFMDKLTPEHFMARYRLIRKLERKYNLKGRKAPQGDPTRFLSFASLVPKVKK